MLGKKTARVPVQPLLRLSFVLSLLVCSLLALMGAGCAPDQRDPQALAAARAAMAGAQLDARALVLSAGAADANAAAITAALGRLGTPYDLVDVTTTPLSADMLATGPHGHYQAIFLARGDLVAGSGAGTSALSTAGWQALTDYEAMFGVRRVSLYTFPDASYGYSGYDTVQSLTTPVAATCTATGAQVLRRIPCAPGVMLTRPTIHAARAADAMTVPLLIDATGRIIAATRTYPDGREALTLNFNQEDSTLATMQILPDVIAWATHGLYLGERHTYISAQLDDLFLASDLYLGGTYRITDADMQALYDWQQTWRQQPNQADLRLSWAVNSQGSESNDALVAKAKAIGPGFAWISHTYDHADMDNMSYADAFDEMNKNNQLIMTLGLKPFSISTIVTPGISGLHNADVMAAAYATGIRYLVSDASIPGSDNPSFNTGLPDFVDPRLFLIPRRATDLDYDASLPNEFLAYFNAVVSSTMSTYPQLIDYESDILLGYLLRGENDPWMFHQANARQHDPGASVLTDLLDATFKKYNALLSFPLVSPTMDVLGGAVAARTGYAAAHVSGLIEPGQAITISSDVAVTVPVTGACAGGAAESYAGDRIAHVAIPAGGSVRVDLGCTPADGSAPDAVAPGTGGSVAGTGGAAVRGTGGRAGTGGAAVMGTGGSPGMGGAPGTGGAMEVAGTGGAAADAGPPVTPHPSGCSCATAPQGESPWSLALGLLAALALAARVRRAAPARVRRPGRR